MSNVCLKGSPILRHVINNHRLPNFYFSPPSCDASPIPRPIAKLLPCTVHFLNTSTSPRRNLVRPLAEPGFYSHSQRQLHVTHPQWRDFRQTARQAAPSLTRSRQEIPPSPALPASEIAKIFAPATVSAQMGNLILRTLQRRRQTGSLLEYGLQLDRQYTNISPDALERALSWLRAKYPLDEVAAAEVWAGLQAKKLEESYIARGQQLGLYKKEARPSRKEGIRGAKKSVKEGYGDDAVVRTGVVYGSDPRAGVLDNLKKFGERRRRAEEKAEKDAQIMEEKLGGLQTVGLDGTKIIVASPKQKLQLKQAEFENKQAAKLQKNAEWVDHYRKLASGSQSTKIPDMTKWQRLAPSTILALSLVALVTLATGLYEPPTQEERMFPDIPPFYLTIGSITAINAAMWIFWKYPPAWRILNKYFVCVPSKPMAFSIFGNLFSHQEIGHLFGNTCALWAFGYELHDYVGRANFLAIYVSGGLIGALMSLWVSVFRGMWNYWHFGASGCTYAVMVAWVVIQATLPLKRDDLWSYSADVGRYAFALLTVFQHMTPRFILEWDVVAHAGGALTGYIWAQILKFHAKLTFHSVDGNTSNHLRKSKVNTQKAE